MSGRYELGWLLLGIHSVFGLSRRAVEMGLIRALAKWGWGMWMVVVLLVHIRGPWSC